ncbi:MAG: hypothetical protein GX868_13235 [Actinobacteria bacterium]|nr:hypothetical protein [Actinomycetota bacterium]
MADVIISLVLGAVIAGVLWNLMQDAFEQEAFLRENYRGQQLPTAVGILCVVPLAVVCGLSAWLDWLPVRSAGLGIAAGFGLLGLLDDVGGYGESGGFKGHLTALASGRLTTGGLKLLGGPVIALAFTGNLLNAATICLAANLANLFDRAPGRTIKVFSFVHLVVALVLWSLPELSVVLVIGAALGLLWGDLHERFMLGDAGSNVIGAMVGVQLLYPSHSSTARWGILAVLFALNLSSEFVSFSKVIAAVPPLRFLDLAGSPHRPR